MLQIYEFNVSTGNMWYTKLFEIYLYNYIIQLKGKGTHICHYTMTSWIALFCGSISPTTFPLQFSVLYYYTLSFHCYYFTILGHWNKKNIPPYNLAEQGKNTNWKVESKWHHWTIQTLVFFLHFLGSSF